MYVMLWEFTVRPGAAEAFERLYGPHGAWVTLFRDAPDYRRTELLRALNAPGRYLAVDWWTSHAAYTAFRRDRHSAYQALNREGEALTVGERLIGEFTLAASSYGAVADEPGP